MLGIGGTIARESDQLLYTCGVSGELPDIRALDGINSALRPGETHVFLGENGAGRSAPIKMLARAHHHDSGTIRVRGREAHIDSPKTPPRLGMNVIYQGFNLVPYFDVAQNIFLDREPRLTGVPGLIDRRPAHQEAAPRRH